MYFDSTYPAMHVTGIPSENVRRVQDGRAETGTFPLRIGAHSPGVFESLLVRVDDLLVLAHRTPVPGHRHCWAVRAGHGEWTPGSADE